MTAPPFQGLALEWPRAVGTAARLPFQWRGLMDVPRGDGRPVMLLPGLFNSDRSNIVLRRYLNAIGYDAQGWQLGRNFGQRTIGVDAMKLSDRIAARVEEAGEPVTLIGVSLGGIMARLMAHRHPDLVREVITVSAPFAGPARATNVWRAYEVISGTRIDDPEVLALAEEAAAPLPVPATAIWSASDGFVNGYACRDGHGAAIEVQSSHVFVQMHHDVMRAVAGVLGSRSDRPS
ncbi:hypothetical protein GCM10009106_01680 [Sphingomonas japonica]